MYWLLKKVSTLALAGVAHLVGVSSCKTKGHSFDSCLQGNAQVAKHPRSLSLSSFHSLKQKISYTPKEPMTLSVSKKLVLLELLKNALQSWNRGLNLDLQIMRKKGDMYVYVNGSFLLISFLLCCESRGQNEGGIPYINSFTERKGFRNLKN